MNLMFKLLFLLMAAGALFALFAAALGLILIRKRVLEKRRESAG